MLLLRATPVVVLAVILVRDPRAPVAAAVVAIASILVLMELLLRTTYYLIEGDMLVIRSGFLTWRIPVRAIRSIAPTHSPASSPALSLDRLRINYDSSFVLVSPDERQRFIEALRAINPAIVA